VTEPVVVTETVVLADVHVPPAVASLTIIVELIQTLVGPETATGFGLTVTGTVMTQPVLVNLYNISEVPGVIPVTIPEDEPMEAIIVVPLAHVPPDVASVNVAVPPTQTAVVPIGAGNGLTVTCLVAEQP